MILFSIHSDKSRYKLREMNIYAIQCVRLFFLHSFSRWTNLYYHINIIVVHELLFDGTRDLRKDEQRQTE